ncbi:MAG TPA: isochorismatase family protein [Pseudonocardia sp.]|jgi:nicotinamidase-related amidase
MASALLVIDAQESFRQRENWAVASNPDIARPIGELVAWARAEQHLVVWVLHTEPGTGTVFDPASGHVRLMPGLDPEPDEPMLTRPHTTRSPRRTCSGC